MRYIKSYTNFKSHQKINEEIFGLDIAWRNLTGETKKRIEFLTESISKIINIFRNVLDECLSKYHCNKESLTELFIEKWSEYLQSLKWEGNNFSNFFEKVINKKNLSPEEQINIPAFILEDGEFVKKLSEDQFKKLQKDTKNLIYSINEWEIAGLAKEECKNYSTNKIIQELNNIIGSEKILEDLLNDNNLLNFYSDLSQNAEGEFIKSLILPIHNEDIDGKFNREDYLGSEDYSKKYGVEYTKLIDDNTWKQKLEDLSRYRKLVEQFNQFKKKYLEIKSKIDDFFRKIDDPKVILSKNDIISQLREMKATNWHFNNKLTPYEDIVEKFDMIKEKYSQKTIGEIFEQLELSFETKRLVVITDNPENLEKNQIQGQNIVYHGSIHDNIDKEKLYNYIRREWPYQKSFAGRGIFSSTDISAACQWAWFRSIYGKITQGRLPKEISDKFYQAGSGYFPTVYKIYLKEDTKFLYKENDRDCSSEEMQYYLNLKLAGHHSGNTLVDTGHGLGASQELVIVEDSCVSGIEKIAIDELEGIENWNIIPFKNASGFNPLGEDYPNCTKEMFISWYRDILKKKNQ